MTKHWVALAATLIVATCSSASPTAGARSPSQSVQPSATPAMSGQASSPSPSGQPGSPPPSTQPTSPTPSAPPGAVSFTGTVVGEPAGTLRFGPGQDMPVLDLVPTGTVLTFNSWYRRADDAPLPDQTSGRIEPWSRDWLHLADGRGWIRSSTVVGQPPPGLAERTWTRPSRLPASTAGIVPAPLDLQDSALTCEVASLKMALAARGISRSEAALLDAVGVDPRPPELDSSGGITRWGDPNAAFVGDPNGAMSDLTGYGVYAMPIARAAVGAGASVLTEGRGVDPATIYRDVVAGHPVVAWVTNDYRLDDAGSWTAWDGSTVTYSPREHAVLVVGVTPSEVVVNDPWWGTIWVTRSEFQASYATLGDMAVVIK